MRGSTSRRLFVGLCLLGTLTGCAAFHPMEGVPARYLPTELKAGERNGKKTIDFSLLSQKPPVNYLIDSGDVLAVYVEGQVGRSTDPPPVHFPLNNEGPASFGLPFPVREDGTISLPNVGSIFVRGQSIAQVEQRVKQAYLSPKQIIHPENYRVQVSLQRPRQYRVLVIRQDSRTEPLTNSAAGGLNLGLVKRGSGKLVSLPAYSNDVLNALTATDGMPGLDAEPAVYVIRRRGPLEMGHSQLSNLDVDGRHVIRIPIRLGPGETADIREEDVILQDGDIVFIESRDTEVFFTGGLLGGGQFTLPRDYDLDILQALSIATSRGNAGTGRVAGGLSALNNDVSISPSTVIVLRKLPDGGEVPIKIDLYRARTDMSERIAIQPGDYILLQYTPLEAIAAFFERHLLEGALFGLAAQSFTSGN